MTTNLVFVGDDLAVKFVAFGLFVVFGLGLTVDGLGLGVGLDSSWPR